ncbi:MAG: hypothetical protein P8R42_23340 [Candidatus Binatia bacterium]|nr:hypothetical protein [Candidatus Binatia bacterium]
MPHIGWPEALSAAFRLLLAAFMPFTVELVPAKFEIFVGWLIIVVIAGALFFPRGVRPQIAISMGLLAWLLTTGGVKPLLIAPMTQDGELLGSLSFSRSSGAPAFEIEQPPSRDSGRCHAP